MERYIGEREVSEITGMALSTLRNQRFHRVGIPYSKLGRAVRYRLLDVLRYMEERRIVTKGR